ncbi:LOW QUALITY PROTEIN: CCT domain containing protein [Trema orientale]|uniref:CCT domain containing protein n=1 Tax=Trema orientale TaxID=63057 RepID=A0A2P5F1X2_TREOI|nr:LOW QUALITY PROTEIN: CCT domain containing protein [Trema orientale]
MASSIPENLYSSLDYTLFPTPHDNDLSGLPIPRNVGCYTNTVTTDQDQEFMVPFHDTSSNIGLENALSPLSWSPTDSLVSSLSLSSSSAAVMAASTSFLPETIGGVSDGVAAAGTGALLFSDHHDYNMMMRDYNIFDNLHGISGGVHENFGGGGYNTNNGLIHELGEECCATSFLPDFKKLGMQSNQMHAIEDPSMIMKVKRYSEEERKERIVRYLKKRNQRNFNKTIKYAFRKTLADRRVRVRGRFARNNEVCHDHEYQQMVAKKKELDSTRKQMDFGSEDADVDADDYVQSNMRMKRTGYKVLPCCWVNNGAPK